MVALQNVQQFLVMLGGQSGLIRESRLLQTCGLTFHILLLQEHFYFFIRYQLLFVLLRSRRVCQFIALTEI